MGIGSMKLVDKTIPGSRRNLLMNLCNIGLFFCAAV